MECRISEAQRKYLGILVCVLVTAIAHGCAALQTNSRASIDLTMTPCAYGNASYAYGTYAYLSGLTLDDAARTEKDLARADTRWVIDHVELDDPGGSRLTLVVGCGV